MYVEERVCLCVCAVTGCIESITHVGQQAVLFIGHALVGTQSVTCRLNGSCAVSAAYLNNMKLRRLSHVRHMLSVLSLSALHMILPSSLSSRGTLSSDDV